MAGVIVTFYLIYSVYGEMNPFVFIFVSALVLVIAIRSSRVPQINTTHRRAIAFHEDIDYYHRDVFPETVVTIVVFVLLAVCHFQFFTKIKSTWLGEYLGAHPLRAFAVILLVPFFVFLFRLFQIVGAGAIWRLMTYIPRKSI
jgi:hypothetical protein